MKRFLFTVLTLSGLALVGCNKPETPQPPPPAPTVTPPANTAAPQSPPSTPTQPSMPPPNPSTADPASGPKPGQVNDHSSPEFKEGGKK